MPEVVLLSLRTIGTFYGESTDTDSNFRRDFA